MFIVTAHRFGDAELHSYPVGIFNTIDRANKAADDETQHRSGKYECKIMSMRVNETFREHMIVIKTL